MGKSINKGQIIKIALAAIAFFVLWFIPTSAIGLPNISIVEHRVIAIFALALILWFTEAIPSWTTSMLIVVIMLLTCTDSSFMFMREGENVGTLLSHKAVMGAFADPTIMLFLGGFVIAIIASKMGIDVQLARVLLLPFGKKSEFVLLGFLLVTGIFSMFISNTATAAMMLTFMAPVLKQLPADDKGRTALVLAIPIGANIGGIGTSIGTPPNMIALDYLNNPEGLNLGISFLDWIKIMAPFAILLLFVAWIILIKLFPFKNECVDLKIEGKTAEKSKLIIAYITLALTVILWITGEWTDISDKIVAMIPIAVFCVLGMFTKDDIKEINWDVIWLVAGGFALGTALNKTGLAASLINAIPFGTWSPIIVIIGASLICYFFSNIISNTATAALMIPVMVAVGTGMGSVLEPFGGIFTIVMGVTLAASLAMILPVSTPPNAIAYSTGMVEVKHMRTMGVIMGVVGLVLALVLVVFVGKTGLML